MTGRDYEIPAFARHLKEFASEKRGYALIKTGTKGRTFYRFENPLLQPFTILHGLERGLISEYQLIERSREAQQPEVLLPDDIVTPDDIERAAAESDETDTDVES